MTRYFVNLNLFVCVRGGVLQLLYGVYILYHLYIYTCMNKCGLSAIAMSMHGHDNVNKSHELLTPHITFFFLTHTSYNFGALYYFIIVVVIF